MGECTVSKITSSSFRKNNAGEGGRLRGDAMVSEALLLFVLRNVADVDTVPPATCVIVCIQYSEMWVFLVNTTTCSFIGSSPARRA